MLYENKNMITVGSYEEFEKYNGQSLGQSKYLKITQEQITQFAEATLDHQWIHTDPKRAVSGPFGTTIAHGYLTLSLVPYLWGQILTVNNLKMTVNYGIEGIKFNQPVPVNSEISLHAKLAKLTNLRGITKAELTTKMEVKGNSKPAFTGTLILLYHFE